MCQLWVSNTFSPSLLYGPDMKARQTDGCEMETQSDGKTAVMMIPWYCTLNLNTLLICITDNLCEITKQKRRRTQNFTFSYIYSLSKKKFELSFLSHSILFHTLTRNVNSFPYLKGPWNGVLIGKYNKSSNLMAK